MTYNQTDMSESNRHTILRAALKAILAASDSQWWIKGPATFAAELKSKNIELPESHGKAIKGATEEELNEVVQEQIEQFQQSQAGLERIEAILAMLRADLNQSNAELLDQFRHMLTSTLKTIAVVQDQSFDRNVRGETYKQPVFNVPFGRHACFKGRDELIRNLRSSLTSGERNGTRQAIRGLGGIGKTQVAVEYAYRFRNDYEAIFWMRSETEIELQQATAESARNLNLPFDQNDPKSACRELRQWLEANESWLMVFDNADTPELLKDLLPRFGDGHILLTSRATLFDAIGILSPIELPLLSPIDAAEFLLARTSRNRPSKEETEAARDLAKLLGFLPLALEQAGAYIKALNIDFAAYVEAFNAQKEELGLLERRKPAMGEYPDSVATTWAVNFDEVESQSPASADILRLSAFLAPSDIPHELIRQGISATNTALAELLSESSTPELAIHEVLQLLTRFSLVNIDRNMKSYSVHQLVQTALRSELDNAALHRWALQAIRMMDRAYPENKFENWKLIRRLMPHIVQVCTYAETYNVAEPEFLQLAHDAGTFLDEQAQHNAAERLFELATELCSRKVGRQHRHYATSLNSLGKTCWKLGKYKKSVSLIGKALRIKRAVLDKHDPSIAVSLNDLATIGMYSGKYEEAEKLYRESNVITLKVLGDQHPDYATGLSNLAELHRMTGKHEDAVRLLRQARKIKRTAFSKNHPDYGVILNNLAGVYFTVRRFGRAELLYRLALRIFRMSLDDQHPYIAQCEKDLKWLRRAKEGDEDAENLLNRLNSSQQRP